MHSLTVWSVHMLKYTCTYMSVVMSLALSLMFLNHRLCMGNKYGFNNNFSRLSLHDMFRELNFKDVL